MNKCFKKAIPLFIALLSLSGLFAQTGNVHSFFAVSKPIPKGSVENPVSGTLRKGKVLTHDDRNADVPTPQPAIVYQTPNTYTINTSIPLLAPENGGGAVPANIYGEVTTFAGSGAPVSVDGLSTAASFDQPSGLGTDITGAVYVTDYGSDAIRKITPAGVVTTINGIAPPAGLTLDNQSSVYVSDFQGNVIYKLGVIRNTTVFAGTGSAGNQDGLGGSFNSPSGLAADAAGNIYVADQQNNSIRMITPAGVIKTIAGSGAIGSANGTGLTASFNNPDGLAVDQQGNVFVADTKNNLVRKISPAGKVTTFAGNGTAGSTDGQGTGAYFNYPTGLAFDNYGDLFVADFKNDAIRKIDPSGKVTTVAGTGTAGSVNGIGTAASFNGPLSLAFDATGNLYITDFLNNLVRKITLTGYTIDKQLPAGLTFDPKTGIISGTPATASPPTDYTVTAYNAGGRNSTVVNMSVTATALLPSVITFPPLPVAANNIIMPGASSTNTETPIIYTSSNPAVAIVLPDGTILLTGVGYATITATQAGNADYSEAVPVTELLTVYEQEFIAFGPIPVKYTGNADFDPGATSDDTAFPITYTSSNPAVATIANGKIHITGVGTSVITAYQAGDVLNVAATPVSQTLTVLPILSFGPIPVKITCDADFGPGATGPYPIAYTSSNTAVAVIINGKLHIIAAGTSTITAITIGESLQQLLTVNAVPQPAISINAVPAFPQCSGTTVSFTAIPANGGSNPTYQWKVNGIDAGENSAQFSSNTLNNGDVVTCTLTNNTTCPIPLSVTSPPITAVIISPLSPTPTLNISASAPSVYFGMPVTFTAMPQNAVGITAYQWKVNGDNAGANESTFTTAALFNNDTVTCTISFQNSCSPPVTSSPYQATVLPPSEIKIVNAFTPNGDGINDTWNIPLLSFYPNCSVEIFNRYGTLVMLSTGYSKPWDGLYNGKQLPTGVYFYIIDLKNGLSRLAGNVTLLR
jgi:gliding motility-associated-like protein